MAKNKINFSDLKIGDYVLTTNNKVGEIIALKSYAYLNDKIDKKACPDEYESKDGKKPFKFDNTAHNGVWYSVVTVAIEDTSASTPTYYTEALDFIEIREILKNHDERKNSGGLLKKLFN